MPLPQNNKHLLALPTISCIGGTGSFKSIPPSCAGQLLSSRLFDDSWSENGQLRRDIILDKSVERLVFWVPVTLSDGVEVRVDM